MPNAFKTIFLIIVFFNACSNHDSASDHTNKQIQCTRDSTNPANNKGVNLIYSAPCGKYRQMVTREENGIEITVSFAIFEPVVNTHAIVILFTGGNGDAGLLGDPQNELLSDSSNNFLVRSAQLFAAQGFRAIVIDRPSELPNFIRSNPEYQFGTLPFDIFRLTPHHGVDIAKITKANNSENLPVFLVGTSRGAMSAFAQHKIAGAISIVNPVTSGETLYIHYPQDVVYSIDGAFASPLYMLAPEFLSVATHILINPSDHCPVSVPGNSIALAENINRADVVTADYDLDFSGLNGLGDLSDNPCQARTFHGFIGIENAAVGKITNWMIEKITAENLLPEKPNASSHHEFLNTLDAKNIDLSSLVDNANENTTYELLWDTSVLGNRLQLQNNIVTYQPTEGISAGIKDYFIYIAKHGSEPSLLKDFGVITLTYQQ